VGVVKTGYLEATTVGFARAFTHAMQSEETARRRGLMQLLDPRVRLAGVVALVIAVVLSRRIEVVAVLFGAAVVLAVASRVSLFTLATRVWLIAFGFTGVIAIPALFTTPGRAVLASGNLAITEQGLRTAALLVLRVETAATLTTLLVLCTAWNQVLKALRALGVPKEAIAMLAMTYRYVFLLVDTAAQMFEARRSRTVGLLKGPEQRQMAARTAGVLLSKSMGLSNDVYLAMQSRGFRGDVQILSEFRMTLWDYLGLLLFVSAAIVAVWAGR
jgi:cobalt/nickel transport system permease protein